ncbi:MAG TPA: LamG-like jellyroll fold domain-containing protein [Candidatus Paceibacterota bacterium]|nr:LamG-like jellyroll fold domain-containing protein [Candidatus Paceibacterota bacterium]
MNPRASRHGFTLIELLVVIAIIAILAVVVVLTLNPAQLLAQSRDANRVSDMATLQSALNLYVTDQAGASTFNLGIASDTYPSIYDPNATSTAGDQCQGLNMASFSTSTGQNWQCAASSSYRSVNDTGWIPVNLSSISAGSPVSNLPQDPTNQTSSGLFYAYNTNGSQFQVTADLESSKYKAQYGNSPNTSYFPEVISGGTQGISALYNPSGLVGYWPMNEGSGSSTIDASGNGNTGTWTGTPIGSNGTYYTGGKVGSYAGDFDGSTNYVTTTSNLPTLTTFTLAAWVDLSSSPGRGFVLWVSPADIEIDGGNLNFNKTGTGGVALSTTAGVTVGAWHFVAATWNGSSPYLYIDGANVTPGSFSYGYTTIGGASGEIGAYNASSFFPGSIDDVRVYGRALSPAEVMALYDSEK